MKATDYQEDGQGKRTRDSSIRAISVKALAWVLRVRVRNAGEKWKTGVLATVELPAFQFNWASVYGTPRPFGYGRVVTLYPSITGTSFVLSELPFREDDRKPRVSWIDGRKTLFGCPGGPCWSCCQMPGASQKPPPGEDD